MFQDQFRVRNGGSVAFMFKRLDKVVTVKYKQISFFLYALLELHKLQLKIVESKSNTKTLLLLA